MSTIVNPDGTLTDTGNNDQGQTQQFVNNSVFPEQQQKIADSGEYPGDTTPVSAPVTAQPPVSKTDELVKRFYSANLPKPQVDQDKLDRIQRMGRINEIGRGVGVLGDILSLGLGGNVNKTEPDETSSRLAKAYQDTLDKYSNDQDTYDLRNFEKTRQDAQFGLSNDDKDRANELALKRINASSELAKAKAEQEWKKFVFSVGQKEADRQSKEKIAKNKNDIAWTNVKLKKDKQDATTGKPFNIIRVNDVDTPLTQGEHRALLEEAIHSKAFTKGDLQAFRDQYQNSPLEGEKNIVQRYAAWKSAQEKNSAQNKQVQPFIEGITTPNYIQDQVRNSQNTVPVQNNPDNNTQVQLAKTVQKPAYNSLNF